MLGIGTGIVAECRNYFRSMLTSLRNNDNQPPLNFALVREKQDLLRTIRMELRSVLPFGHNWVAVINEEGLTMTCFLTEPESLARNHPLYQQVIRKKYPIND